MKRRILIVDDEPDILQVLTARLQNAGYGVIKSSSGQDAIALAKKERPDLIVLDVMMPGVDGGDVAHVLQNSPETKDIPIIFLTCLVTKEEEKASKTIAGHDFIAKPYNPEELLKLIGDKLNK